MKSATGVFDGTALTVGNAALIKDLAIDATPLRRDAERLGDEGKTPIYVAADGALAGLLAVAYPIKATSREAIATFVRMGLDTGNPCKGEQT